MSISRLPAKYRIDILSGPARVESGTVIPYRHQGRPKYRLSGLPDITRCQCFMLHYNTLCWLQAWHSEAVNACSDFVGALLLLDIGFEILLHEFLELQVDIVWVHFVSDQ